jgi:hypothetical protein
MGVSYGTGWSGTDFTRLRLVEAEGVKQGGDLPVGVEGGNCAAHGFRIVFLIELAPAGFLVGLRLFFIEPVYD